MRENLIIYPIDRMCHPSAENTVSELPSRHHPLSLIDDYKEGRETALYGCNRINICCLPLLLADIIKMNHI
jgi:hypothetical protein